MGSGGTAPHDVVAPLTASGVPGREVTFVAPVGTPVSKAVAAAAVAALVAVGLVVPAALWPVVLAGLAAIAVSATVSITTHVVVATTVLAFVALLGQVHDVDGRWPVLGGLASVALCNGVVGARVRRRDREARRDLRFAVEAAGGLTHVTLLGSGLVSMDGDVERVVGWPRDEWMTMDQFQVVHPDDHGNFTVEADQVVDGQVLDRIGRIRTKDGRWIWVRDISRVVETDAGMELHGFTVDVTAQQVGLDRVTTEATTDPLTGLWNRRALNAELARLGDGDGHHLVLMDLDRFKEVNDTLGHEAGDALLRVVSARLVDALSDGDAAARLGGDEFALLLPQGRSTQEVVALVDRLADDLARPVAISGLQLTTSMSAGIVRAGPTSADRSTMLRHADVAMYAAKRSDVPSVVFDDQMGGELERRLVLSTQLAHAMASGQIALHFQPIVDSTDARLVGVEGLARWEHEQRGLLQPAEFLDVILVSERAGQFTRHVVAQAIDAAATMAAAGSDATVAVNVPVRAFEDDAFEGWLLAACDAASVTPDRLVLEVSERDLHDDVATVAAIQRLARTGAKISIDDFGTGHANFDRLRWRDVSQIKLDRRIIATVTEDPRDEVIVRSMLDLAHELGLAVVAEGVETTEQLELLRTLGCERVQGYLFSPAVPLEDVLATTVR